MGSGGKKREGISGRKRRREAVAREEERREENISEETRGCITEKRKRSK